VRQRPDDSGALNDRRSRSGAPRIVLPDTDPARTIAFLELFDAMRRKHKRDAAPETPLASPDEKAQAVDDAAGEQGGGP
jgi:hypothetical protein